jgi:hypothetical protein
MQIAPRAFYHEVLENSVTHLLKAVEVASEVYGGFSSKIQVRHVEPDTNSRTFAAKTCKTADNSYVIYVNITVTPTLSHMIHEVAHIVAWDRPELGAEGHNGAYMDILYNLEEAVKSGS